MLTPARRVCLFVVPKSLVRLSGVALEPTTVYVTFVHTRVQEGVRRGDADGARKPVTSAERERPTPPLYSRSAVNPPYTV